MAGDDRQAEIRAQVDAVINPKSLSEVKNFLGEINRTLISTAKEWKESGILTGASEKQRQEAVRIRGLEIGDIRAHYNRLGAEHVRGLQQLRQFVKSSDPVESGFGAQLMAQRLKENLQAQSIAKSLGDMHYGAVRAASFGGAGPIGVGPAGANVAAAMAARAAAAPGNAFGIGGAIGTLVGPGLPANTPLPPGPTQIPGGPGLGGWARRAWWGSTGAPPPPRPRRGARSMIAGALKHGMWAGTAYLGYFMRDALSIWREVEKGSANIATRFNQSAASMAAMTRMGLAYGIGPREAVEMGGLVGHGGFTPGGAAQARAGMLSRALGMDPGALAGFTGQVGRLIGARNAPGQDPAILGMFYDMVNRTGMRPWAEDAMGVVGAGLGQYRERIGLAGPGAQASLMSSIGGLMGTRAGGVYTQDFMQRIDRGLQGDVGRQLLAQSIMRRKPGLGYMEFTDEMAKGALDAGNMRGIRAELLMASGGNREMAEMIAAKTFGLNRDQRKALFASRDEDYSASRGFLVAGWDAMKNMFSTGGGVLRREAGMENLKYGAAGIFAPKLEELEMKGISAMTGFVEKVAGANDPLGALAAAAAFAAKSLFGLDAKGFTPETIDAARAKWEAKQAHK